MSECHDVEAILAWIPPRDRDRITERMHGAAGEHAAWTLAALAYACRQVGTLAPAADDREQSAALLAVMLDRLYPERAPHRWSFNPNGYKYSGAPRL